MSRLLIAALCVFITGCAADQPVVKRDQLILEVPQELLIAPEPLKKL